MKKIMIIINPQSGKSDGVDYEEIIKESLKDKFDEIIFKITEKQGDGTEFAKLASSEKFHSVCSVGGDGTLAEVLTGLVNSEYVPNLLIFPAGTGNIMSKSLYIDQDKNKTLENIDFENPIYIDIGLANDRCFSFILSIGKLPETLNEVENEEKEKLGMFAYALNVIKNIGEERDYNLEITVDDKKYSGEVDHLFVTLSENYGTFKIPNIDSKVDDGYLNVIILKDKSIFSKAKIGLDLIFGGEFDSSKVEIMRGKNITIKSLDSNEIFIDLDGDKGPSLPVNIKVISNKVKVYTPFNIAEKL